MLDFKKHGSKILTIIACIISCASFALSMVALHSSRKQMHEEPFKCTQETLYAKDGGMKHPKCKHCDEKKHRMESKYNSKKTPEGEKSENAAEDKKSDK